MKRFFPLTLATLLRNFDFVPFRNIDKLMMPLMGHTSLLLLKVKKNISFRFTYYSS